jgi:hypothetical protein
MALALSASDSIRLKQDVGTDVNLAMSGDEITVASNADAYKSLLTAGQQLTTSVVAFGPAAGLAWIVSSIKLTNSGASTRTVTCYLNGATAAYQWGSTVVLLANESAEWDDEGWRIYDANGLIKGPSLNGSTFLASDGAVGAPGFAFNSEATSGLYRIGAGDVALSILGVKVAEFLNGGTAQYLNRSGANENVSLVFQLAGVNKYAIGAGITANAHQFAIYDSVLGNAELLIDDVALLTTIRQPLAVSGASATVGVAAGGKVIAAGTLTAGGLLGSAVQIGTSGPLIYSGSGVPTISAAVKGSLYLRSDGTTNVTRAYIATDAAGTWTAINTVA